MPARKPRPLPTQPPRPLRTYLPLLAAVMALAALLGWGLAEWRRPRDPATQPVALRQTSAQDRAALLAFGVRPAGSPAGAQARAWLAGQFRALGYHVSEQPVTVPRLSDRGGELRVGERTWAVAALPGSRGGQQEGRLVRVPPDAPRGDLERLGLRGNLALTTCPAGGWADLAERVVSAGAFGLVAVNDCEAMPSPVPGTPLPLVTVPAREGAAVLALAGEMASLESRVEEARVTGGNLLARRVESVPSLVVGAALDTGPDPAQLAGRSSGPLAVLALARRLAADPLAGQVWFVLFDAREDGRAGSEAFVAEHAYALGQTRAMLLLDEVGGSGEMRVAGHPELWPLARRVQPGTAVFTEALTSSRETFGRTLRTSGQGDHVPFQVRGTRTLRLTRAAPGETGASGDGEGVGVEETAIFTQGLMGEVLRAPWTPVQSCGILARDCRN